MTMPGPKQTGIRRVYLSGPMRGRPRLNYPAFMEAATALRQAGYRVFNPAEQGQETAGLSEPRVIRKHMTAELPAVLRSDAVVLLPGWEGSMGAGLEVQTARFAEIPVLLYPSLDLAPEDVLDAAARLTRTARNAQCGPPDQDFQRVAGMWTALFGHLLRDGLRFRPKDVAYAMICLKLSRAQWSDDPDHLVDTAGYARCAALCYGNGKEAGQ